MKWSKSDIEDTQRLLASYWSDIASNDLFESYYQALRRFRANDVRAAAKDYYATAETTFRPPPRTLADHVRQYSHNTASTRDVLLEKLLEESRHRPATSCPIHHTPALVLATGVLHPPTDDTPALACMFGPMSDDQVRLVFNNLGYPDRDGDRQLMRFEEFRDRTLAGEQLGVSIETMRAFAGGVKDVNTAFDFGENEGSRPNEF